MKNMGVKLTTQTRSTDNRDQSEMDRYHTAQIEVLRNALRDAKQTIERLESEVRILNVQINGHMVQFENAFVGGSL
jgi:RNA-binding protein YhbY